jgi:hypothetical protein
VVVLHGFCNYMGFPDFARMAGHPRRAPLLACLFAVSERGQGGEEGRGGERRGGERKR